MSVFSAGLVKTIEGFLTRYETKRSAILPVLHAIQDESGWISPEAIEELHTKFALDRIHVKEVITFYDIYHDEPTKKYVLRFCHQFTCHMLGAPEAIRKIEAKIDAMGESCPFQLEKFPCLGKCDGAPVLLVNKDRHERVTEDKVDAILAKYERTHG